MKLLICGIILCMFSVGAVEQLPPTATMSDWLLVVAVGLMGLLSAALGALSFQE